MINMLTKVPRKINLAFSGGVDSFAVAHFLQRGKHDVTLLHFNHGCQYSDEIEANVRDRVNTHLQGLPLIVKKIDDSDKPKGQSIEDYWRRARYRWLRSFNEPFITCHHLDDAVETWIFSAIHGNPKIIPVQDELVIRPFLITEKLELTKYALRNGLVPVYDEFNNDQSKMRNYIRANIMQHAYKINPGLKKVIRKKYLKEMNDE